MHLRFVATSITNIVYYRLVNLAVPNTLRFKAKAVMPFVQMENISLFLDACKSAPFNLQSHDTFLTVDLFEHGRCPSYGMPSVKTHRKTMRYIPRMNAQPSIFAFCD